MEIRVYQESRFLRQGTSLGSLLELSFRSGCEHLRPENLPKSIENFLKDTHEELKKCILG